jgi:3-hydroxyisobutyrate dehydrogenase
MVAFLGMGLLGSSFVKAMLRKGQEVNVWNRTAAKARVLQELGAKAYDNVAEAVKRADRIHLALSDDAAVDEVLEQASAGFSPEVIIIDHTTTSVTGSIRRTQYWKDRGNTYLHAPVFMGPQNAYDSTGYMLVSGDQELIHEMQPTLSAMTGKLLNLGTEPGRAAGIKLLGNSFLLFLTAGLSDTLALAKSMSIPSSDLVALFDEWNPGAFVPARLKRILDADYDNPSWELNMARKDARLMMEEADKGNARLATIPTIAAEMDRWIAQGQAHKDWTVITKDNVC